MSMSTHRHVQIHSLLDTAESKARTYRRCASNLARIGNLRGAMHYLCRATKAERLAFKCARRLA